MWVCSTRLTKCIRIFWLVWFPRKLILIWKCNQISSVVAYQAYNCQYNLNKKKCKLQKPIELCKFERKKLVICYLQFAVPRMRHMCVRAVLVIRIFDWNAYCGECCECVCFLLICLCRKGGHQFWHIFSKYASFPNWQFDTCSILNVYKFVFRLLCLVHLQIEHRVMIERQLPILTWFTEEFLC